MNVLLSKPLMQVMKPVRDHWLERGSGGEMAPKQQKRTWMMNMRKNQAYTMARSRMARL